MNFNIKNGSSTLITIALMVIIVSITAFGLLLAVTYMDTNTETVINDPTNLSGISVNTELSNATNQTAHGLSAIMPNFIYFLLIFLAIAFIVLLAIALKRH